MQCYLHDACYCSMLLAWWMLMQYVTWWMLMQYHTCLVDVNAICYLHDACYCIMLLSWLMLMQYVICLMHVIAVFHLHGGC